MKNQKKWLIGIIALLILMNMTILAFFWLDRRPPSPNKITGHFAKELNLSANQEETFSVLFETHTNNAKAIMDSTQIYKEKILEALIQPNKNFAELEDFIQRISTLQGEKEKELVQHFITLEKTCESEEQREKLREIFKRSLPKHRPRPD